MNKLLFAAVAAISFNGLCGAQVSTGIPEPTHDWGCEVLLCLANPAGPMAVAPCVPPIERLWRELARGRAFPSCAMASGPEGRSYAKPAFRYHDPCPAGTTALGVGEMALLAAPSTRPPNAEAGSAGYAAALVGTPYAGIGEGYEYGPVAAEGRPPPKVCVAGLRGARLVRTGEDFVSVAVFDTVYVAQAPASPRAIDVYIDDRLWHTVRW